VFDLGWQATPDGKMQVAYLPNNSALVLAAPSAQAAIVRWWDPASSSMDTTPGTCAAVAGGVQCPKPATWTADALAIVELAMKSDDEYTRHSAWWRPVGCGNSISCQNATLASLENRFGSWVFVEIYLRAFH
jgi:hypothetical protein